MLNANFCLPLVYFYLLVGAVIIVFTRARTQILSEAKDTKDKTGAQAPLYKVILLNVILFTVGLLFWPFFLSSWFSQKKRLYESIVKNLPVDDSPIPTEAEMLEQGAKHKRENAAITISDAAFPFPTMFKFYIGGHFGASHQFRLVGHGELEYKFCRNGNYHWEAPILLKPERDQWKEFWREMDAQQVWQWNPEYSSRVLDGTTWSFCADFLDRSIESEGQNGYPETKDSSYPEGGQFDSFLKALQKLTGIKNIS